MTSLKNLFNKNFFTFLLVGFLALRLLSFILVDYPILENILVIIIVLALIFTYYQNPRWAWFFLLIEIFIGGAGQFLSLADISLRSWLLIVFLALYFGHLAWQKNFSAFKLPSQAEYFFWPLLVLLTASGLLGLANNNILSNVLADFVPFAYFLLIFPAKEFIKEKANQQLLFNGLLALLIGSAIWSLFNYVVFVSGFHLVHDNYYQWLRDINLGKITQVTQYYYRIVFPEHLLIVPLLLLLNSHWLKVKDKLITWSVVAASLILALNFSRGYFLGLAAGLLFLKYKNSWKNWLRACITAFLIIFLLFTGINFLASGGRSFGGEIMGLRLTSFTVPTIEESSNNRILLLPAIWEKIEQEPLLGQGLGQSLSFYNAQGKLTTTRHFDWGYLEMWAEWGLFPLIFFILLLFTIIRELIANLNKNQALALGLLAGLISLLVINLTSPALFHVLGIVYLALLWSIALYQLKSSRPVK